MNRITHLLQNLFPTGNWEQGYWGRIPYLLMLRCSAAVAIWLRFRINASSAPEWMVLILTISLLCALFLHWHAKKQKPHPFVSAVVIVDIFLISLGYWQTHLIESDLFLFYALPILTTAEYLSRSWIVGIFLATSFSFATVVVAMPVQGRYADKSHVERFARVFLPREFFYVGMVLVWAVRSRRERDANAMLASRQNQMLTLLQCRDRVDESFDLANVLQTVINHAGRGVSSSVVAGVLSVPDWYSPRSESRQFSDLVTSTRYFEKWTGSKDTLTEIALENCKHVIAGEMVQDIIPVSIRGHRVGAIAILGLAQRSAEASQEYLQALAQLTATAYDRARLFMVMREVAAAAALASEHNRTIERMLDELVNRLGFGYATISLVEPYRERIVTIRGRNVPPGWIAASVHSLNDGDIVPDVVRTKKTEFFDDYDHRFKRSIWKRYNHDRLARVYAPIVTYIGDKCQVVGVIEAGSDKDQRQTVLDRMPDVRRVGEERGPEISGSLPVTILERMAGRAIDLIGAQSASLHVFRKGEDEELLIACAGRADQDFARKFRPSREGIGRRAIRDRIFIVEQQLPAHKKLLHNLGIRSMGAFPLQVSEQHEGVLYIHFWQEEASSNSPEFSAAAQEMVWALIPQMEIAISNYFLLHDSSTLDERSWMLTGLQNLLRSLSSEATASDRLGRLARDVQYMLDSKNVTLYEYFEADKRFSRAVLAGRFEEERAMGMEVHDDDIVSIVIGEGASRFITEAQTNEFLRQHRARPEQPARFVEREDIHSCAILVLRSPYDGEIVGALFANYVEHKEFDEGFKQLAHLLASSAALAIKAVRLHGNLVAQNEQDAHRREEELRALRNVDGLIISGKGDPDIDKVCQQILDEALRVLGPRVSHGDISLWDADKHILRVRAHNNYPEGWLGAETTLGEGIVGWVAMHRQPELLNDVQRDPRYRQVLTSTRSELAVPIVAHDGALLGVINVEHQNVNAFAERDKGFLELLAVQATIALDIMRLYRSLQRTAEQSLTLKIVASRIQDASVSESTLVRQVLVGITCGVGLRFSRAVLLEVTDDDQELQGTIAIGALTRHAAEQLWTNVEHRDVSELLDIAASDDPRRQEMLTDAAFEQLVLSVTLRRDDLPVKLRDHLTGGKRDVLPLASSELASCRLGELYAGVTSCPLLCAPLLSGGRITGFLLLDNKFLFTEQTVAVDPGMLTAFTDLLLMIKLRGALASEQQSANQREASTRAAHALENRVLNIENGLSDLMADLNAWELEAARAKAQSMSEAVRDLKGRLQKIKKFGSKRNLVWAAVDLRYELDHLARTRQRDVRCDIVTQLPQDSVYIQGDKDTIPDMFLDLIYNADRATRSKSSPLLIISLTLEGSHTALIHFDDNGVGVPEPVRQKIFEPYITHSGGTGLGLPIIKQLIEQHGGDVRCSASELGGARFAIRLPTAANDTLGL